MTHWMEHPPRLLAAYLMRGEAGLTDLEERIHEQAHDEPGEKFGKRDVAYLPQSPLPPTLWPMRCGRCRFWEEGAPGQPGTCHVVGREDDPYGGEAIHPRGWCGLYMPPSKEPAFAWLHERLDPDGASSVRGLYQPWVATGRWGTGDEFEQPPSTDPGEYDDPSEGADDDD